VASAHGQGNTATFWEQGGSQIEFIELPVSGNFNPTKISFESKDGAKIKYFVIAVQEPGNDQGIFFDNLTWH
jgi:prolyl oligopeptidase PreP (S9A serine peptidase family)